jgi:hypothetical protein
MDGIKSQADLILLSGDGQLADRSSSLAEAVAMLEQSSAILESLELTLAVALLDHTIAEVRRHMAA